MKGKVACAGVLGIASAIGLAGPAAASYQPSEVASATVTAGAEVPGVVSVTGQQTVTVYQVTGTTNGYEVVGTGTPGIVVTDETGLNPLGTSSVEVGNFGAFVGCPDPAYRGPVTGAACPIIEPYLP